MLACKGREALQYFYGDVALFRKKRKMGKGKGKCQNYQGVFGEGRANRKAERVKERLDSRQ